MQTTVGDIADFYSMHPECMGKIKVKTRNGPKTIQYADITAYNSDILRVELSGNLFLECSPDHRIMSESFAWIHAKDLKIGDLVITETGLQEVLSLKKLSHREDLYDLQVDGYEYYANGIVSHNSTIIESITFALFGKPFRNINKPQLVNSITGRELLVELEFSIGKNSYMIRRGMKPSVFEVYCNDVLLNQEAEMRDYQELLERRVLKTNYKSFCQVVVLGSASYQPFMQLSAGQRRAIIEDLLDLQVFTVMNTLLKSQIQENSDLISENSSEQRLVSEKIKMLRAHLSEMKSRSAQFIREKETTLRDIESKIRELVESCGQLRSQAESLIERTSGAESLKSKLEKLRSIRTQMEAKTAALSREVKFFSENSRCPTCKQPIDHEFSCEVVTTRSGEIKEVESGLEKLAEKYSQVQSQLSEVLELDKQYEVLMTKVSHDSLKIKMYRDQAAAVTRDIQDAEKESEDLSDSKVSDLEGELNDLASKYNELQDNKLVLSAAAAMLKDGGIKTKIVNQYVPIINKLINKYLSEFDMFVEFHLDEQFNESIKSRHRDDFSYASFSEGEKQKIDLAILFTWRAVAKLRNSLSTNLLILDEVTDSSMDSTGIDSLQKILSSKENTSVFIISHRSELKESTFFNNVLSFKKNKNFSQMYNE